MANVNVPYAEAGLASFEQLDTYLQQFLLSGDHPRLASYPMLVKADEELSQFQVVGVEEATIGGNAVLVLVPATWDADPEQAVKAIGVVTQAVKGAPDGSTSVPTFYSGCFNPEALVWDASFDTDGKKMGAFNGAPTPTQITLRTRG